MATSLGRPGSERVLKRGVIDEYYDTTVPVLLIGRHENVQACTQSPCAHHVSELDLIHIQMAQRPVLRAEVYARSLRASHNVKRAEVWVDARCASWVGGAWASAGVEGTRMEWRDL
jgi:hypothetical protein